MALGIDSPLGVRPDLSPAPDALAARSVAAPIPGFARALEQAAHASRTTAAPGVREVAPVRTPLSGSGAARALGAAWQNVLGRAPSSQALSLLVAQWAHETGRGSAMLNHNFGGLKGASPSGMSAVYATHEGSGPNQRRVRAHFRAYDSAEQGAEDYVSLLARRYPEAVSAAERGDAAGFVQALQQKGYFTGDATSYLNSVSALAQQALTRGFDALGAADGSRAANATGQARGAPLLASSGAGAATSGSQLAGAPDPLPLYGGGSFADEVGRAALLSSALRIGRARENDA